MSCDSQEEFWHLSTDWLNRISSYISNVLSVMGIQKKFQAKKVSTKVISCFGNSMSLENVRISVNFSLPLSVFSVDVGAFPVQKIEDWRGSVSKFLECSRYLEIVTGHIFHVSTYFLNFDRIDTWILKLNYLQFTNFSNSFFVIIPSIFNWKWKIQSLKLSEK